MSPWFGFWIFMACAALGIAYGSHGLSGQERVALEMARQGKSPFVIQCVLHPPAQFLSGSCDKAMAAEGLH